MTPGGKSRDFIEDGDSVRLDEERTGACSNCGVGGVTVVDGAGIAVWGGVCRRGTSGDSRTLGSVKSVRIGFGIEGIGGGGSAAGISGAFFEDKLLLRLMLHALSPDVEDARSRFELFLSDVKAFLRR
jgi:hypothetical protein